MRPRTYPIHGLIPGVLALALVACGEPASEAPTDTGATVDAEVIDVAPREITET